MYQIIQMNSLIHIPVESKYLGKEIKVLVLNKHTGVILEELMINVFTPVCPTRGTDWFGDAMGLTARTQCKITS